MLTCNRFQSVGGRRVSVHTRAGHTPRKPSTAIRLGSHLRSPSPGVFSSQGRLPNRSLRDVRLHQTDLRRRAELDFVDYRNLNGVHEEEKSEGSHDAAALKNGFSELDQDIEELDAADTKPGLWQRLRGPRAFFAYLSNPQELGKRGEGLFIVTLIIAVCALFPPVAVQGCLKAMGWLMIVAGVVSAVAGIISLGSSFSPFPVPKTDATFVARGIFRFVRHPFYSGIFFIALGSSLATGNEFRLLLTAVLYWILDQTMRGEERDLEAVYPEYTAYKERVAKFIPYVY